MIPAATKSLTVTASHFSTITGQIGQHRTVNNFNKKWILNARKEVVEVDLMKWALWIEQPDNKIVARTFLKLHWVSTVFLGIDHSFTDHGAPVLFETMVFENGTGHEDRDMDRYCTHAEAMAGHKRMVRKWRRKEKISANSTGQLLSTVGGSTVSEEKTSAAPRGKGTKK